MGEKRENSLESACETHSPSRTLQVEVEDAAESLKTKPKQDTLKK